MVALTRRFVAVAGSLALPLVCIASPPNEAKAIRNCAQAEALRLDAHLAATRDELVTPITPRETDRGADQMVVIALDHKGREVAQMLCTYDRNGRVVELRPAASTPLALDLYR